jgi:heptaprenyl diphosphate synthase
VPSVTGRPAGSPSPSPATVALDVSLAEPALADLVRTGLEAVEARLLKAVEQADPLADDASRHLVSAGGKRVRPLLTLLSAQFGDPTRPEIIDAAVVVELTHLASLYHDDVMDSAPLRRGAPAAHEVWGNTVAILTGDLLFARAATVAAGLGVEAVRIQASTFERLCLGQLHETIGPRPGQDPVAHYVDVLADKTGSLIATSARFGAMFAGCADPVLDVLIRYGERVGVAFQLADDVIDLSSDGATSGKTPGTDLREGVATLPVLLARRYADEQADTASKHLVSLLDGDLSDDATLAETVALLREHPAMDVARAEAIRWAQEAVTALEHLPQGPATRSLRAFAEAVVDRTA